MTYSCPLAPQQLTMSWYSAKKNFCQQKGVLWFRHTHRDKSRVISLYIKAHILTFPTGGAVWDCCCCWCYWSTKTCMPCKGKLHIQTTEKTNWSILYKQYHGCTGYIIFKIEAISQIVPNFVNCTMVSRKIHFLNKNFFKKNAAKTYKKICYFFLKTESFQILPIVLWLPKRSISWIKFFFSKRNKKT